MPLFLLKNWKLILVAAVAATVFFAGWTANGWRLGAEIDSMRSKWSAAATEASETARKREQQLNTTIAELDARYTNERRLADEETNRLRAAVDAGARRLRLAATCPTDRVSVTTDGPGVDPGAGAELTADARSAYFDLRAGLTRVETKLAACQGVLKGERKN